MKTARDIAEKHLSNQDDVDNLELDILRYLEYHYSNWVKSEIKENKNEK